mmetsp:Transcript_9886/g.26854  ORF Transcript_9886/g.26854 Transcript_9886/m.26854 type:complete len:208 (+) Transcript_9886:673-1296(+)
MARPSAARVEGAGLAGLEHGSLLVKLDPVFALRHSDNILSLRGDGVVEEAIVLVAVHDHLRPAHESLVKFTLLAWAQDGPAWVLSFDPPPVLAIRGNGEPDAHGRSLGPVLVLAILVPAEEVRPVHGHAAGALSLRRHDLHVADAHMRRVEPPPVILVLGNHWALARPVHTVIACGEADLARGDGQHVGVMVRAACGIPHLPRLALV